MPISASSVCTMALSSSGLSSAVGVASTVSLHASHPLVVYTHLRNPLRSYTKLSTRIRPDYIRYHLGDAANGVDVCSRAIVLSIVPSEGFIYIGASKNQQVRIPWLSRLLPTMANQMRGSNYGLRSHHGRSWAMRYESAILDRAWIFCVQLLMMGSRGCTWSVNLQCKVL